MPHNPMTYDLDDNKPFGDILNAATTRVLNGRLGSIVPTRNRAEAAGLRLALGKYRSAYNTQHGVISAPLDATTGTSTNRAADSEGSRENDSSEPFKYDFLAFIIWPEENNRLGALDRKLVEAAFQQQSGLIVCDISRIRTQSSQAQTISEPIPI